MDLKGYRQSEKNRGDYRHTIVAEQLVALLDAIGVRQFTLVAHDRGTVQGDHITAAHPGRVRHYVRSEGHLHHFHPDLAPHDDLLAEAPWTGIMEDQAINSQRRSRRLSQTRDPLLDNWVSVSIGTATRSPNRTANAGRTSSTLLGLGVSWGREAG